MSGEQHTEKPERGERCLDRLVGHDSSSRRLNEVTIFGTNYDGALTDDDEAYWEGRESEPCPTCRGSGQYDDCTPCPDCDGDGTSLW